MMFGIPTALTVAETLFLRNVARGRLVYEAGALLGHSTVALAQTAKRVVSVDPHTGYPRRRPTPTWRWFLANLISNGVMEKVHAIRSTFQQALPIGPFGFAWADLTGDDFITKAFLEVTHHIPLVAVHDYQRGGCSGATREIDDYIRVYRPKVMRVDTTILLEKV